METPGGGSAIEELKYMNSHTHRKTYKQRKGTSEDFESRKEGRDGFILVHCLIIRFSVELLLLV